MEQVATYAKQLIPNGMNRKKESPPKITGANYESMAVQSVQDIEVSDVVLTEEEKGSLLFRALEAKRYKIGSSRYLQQCQQESHVIEVDYDRMREIAIIRMAKSLKHRHGDSIEVQVDKWNERQIKSLSMYFSSDTEFEKQDSGYSLKKGLLIQGAPGCGKTMLMNAFSLNPHGSYIMADIADKSDDIIDESTRKLVQNELSKVQSCAKNRFGQTRLGICIDDAGFEIDRKIFGNPVDLLLAVIRKRYSKNIPGRLTHMVTNLTVDQLKERYGTRFASRISEMFNQITFHPNSPDRRKLIQTKNQSQ